MRAKEEAPRQDTDEGKNLVPVEPLAQEQPGQPGDKNRIAVHENHGRRARRVLDGQEVEGAGGRLAEAVGQEEGEVAPLEREEPAVDDGQRPGEDDEGRGQSEGDDSQGVHAGRGKEPADDDEGRPRTPGQHSKQVAEGPRLLAREGLCGHLEPPLPTFVRSGGDPSGKREGRSCRAAELRRSSGEEVRARIYPPFAERRVPHHCRGGMRSLGRGGILDPPGPPCLWVWGRRQALLWQPASLTPELPAERLTAS